MGTTVYVEYSGDPLVGAVNGVNADFTISRAPDAASVFAWIVKTLAWED